MWESTLSTNVRGVVIAVERTVESISLSRKSGPSGMQVMMRFLCRPGTGEVQLAQRNWPTSSSLFPPPPPAVRTITSSAQSRRPLIPPLDVVSEANHGP